MDDNLKTRLRVIFRELDALPDIIKTINQDHQHSSADLIPMLQAHFKGRWASAFGVDISDVEDKNGNPALDS